MRKNVPEPMNAPTYERSVFAMGGFFFFFFALNL